MKLSYQEIIDRIGGGGKIYRLSNGGVQVCCPAHEDKNPSLSINIDNDKVLVKCHANCSTEDILKKVGLTMSDLYLDDNADRKIKKKYPKFQPAAAAKEKHEYVRQELVAEYIYRNADDQPVHKVIRIHYYDDKGQRVKKSFFQKQYINGKLEKGTDQVEKLPYHLPDILKAQKFNRPIWIVEGEKDVENMYRHGYVATCFASGHTWQDHYKQYFENAIVYIIPDNDEAGRKKASEIAEGLYDTACFIRFCEIPDLPEKGDVSDWFEITKGKQKLNKYLSECYKPEEKKYSIRQYGKKLFTKIYIKEKEDKQGNVKWSVETYKIAEQIHQHYNIGVMEINEKKYYFQYKDGYWQRQTLSTINRLFDQWLMSGDRTAYKKKQVRDVLGDFEGKEIKAEDINTNPHLLNLNNCVFDLKNHRAIRHDPKYIMTYKLDYNYEPDADCPVFDSALNKYSLGQEDWIKTFWEIAGYCTTGTYEHQKLFWFLGKSGGNGKGTVLRIMHNLVGDLYTQIVSKTKELSGQFFRVSLRNKRLAYVPDMEERFSEFGLVKQLTGGDKQMSDVKYGEYVSFETTAKIVMAMNQMPDFGDKRNLNPLARRVIILKFDYTLNKSDIDPDIERKFAMEMPGIFNKAMEGLKRLQEQKDFTDTEKGKEELKMFINHQGYVGVWAYEYLIYDPSKCNDPEYSTHYFRLFESYVKYMQEVYPHWRNDPYIIHSSPQLIAKLQQQHFKPKPPSIRKATKQIDLNYKNPLTGEIISKTGSHAALGGVRFITESELEQRYRMNGTAHFNSFTEQYLGIKSLAVTSHTKEEEAF